MSQWNGPERFGKYRVTEILGQGAMGAVYKAFDPDIKRPVAIKTINWDLLQDAGLGETVGARFRNEAQAAGRLTHPGIVAVYEYGQSADCVFIAMEYVEGCDLSRYFARGTTFAEADIVSIVVQLLEALTHAHERKVWHRDIKPSNLIIMNDGRLKIADFGIARIDTTETTRTFPLMGTPGYTPPELYRGKGGDHRADIFAAGAVMYQLLAGRPAFEGNLEAVIYQVCNQEPAPLAADDGSRPWDPVVRRALAKDPGERYASASAFRDAILAAYSRPVNTTVSQDTIIVSNDRTPRAGDPSPPTPTTAGSVPGRTSWPLGWDPALLGSVESQLARVIGPMARVLVRRAAGSCEDLDTLVNILVGELKTADERQAFLSRLTLGSVRPTRGQAPAPSAPKRTQSDPAAGTGRPGLEPRQIERAEQVLATLIGPLARIIVKRASDQTSDLEQFYQLAAAGIASESDRAAFLREVHAER